MSRSYYTHVRDRIHDGDVAVYTSRARMRYVYRRDGAYFELTEGRSVYEASETRISTRSLQAAVNEHYPVEVVGCGDLHPAIRARIGTGGVEAVASEWLVDARRLVQRLRDGDADRARASEMIGIGARLEERVDDEEQVERLQRREEEIGDAVGEE